MHTHGLRQIGQQVNKTLGVQKEGIQLQVQKSLKHLLYVFLVFQAVLWLGGCTSYRVANIPNSQSSPTLGDIFVNEVSIGHQVRVTRQNGEVQTGRVVRFSETELFIEKRGNYGLEEISITIENIETIETEGVAGTVQSGLGAAAIVVFVVLSFLVFFGTTGGPAGN